jgi:hypothetical protein
MNALQLASVGEHPNAVWLTKLFSGRNVASREEARQVFLGCENDARALCFAGFLRDFDDVRRAANLGDALAQAWMAEHTYGEERFRWAEKSAAQGERDGFYWLGHCYHNGFGCEEHAGSAKENLLVAAELGCVKAMAWLGRLLNQDDPQRFVWLGRAAAAAAANKESCSFVSEMLGPLHNFNSGTGHVNVFFAIGRALKGHVDNEEEKIFGNDYKFGPYIGAANQALRFYNFQLQSYRKAVDSWTIIGLRNRVVKDIRKMIGR